MEGRRREAAVGPHDRKRRGLATAATVGPSRPGQPWVWSRRCTAHTHLQIEGLLLLGRLLALGVIHFHACVS